MKARKESAKKPSQVAVAQREAAKPPFKLDLDTVKSLAQILEQHGLSELSLTLVDGEVTLRKGVAADQVAVVPAPARAAAPPPPAAAPEPGAHPAAAAATAPNGRYLYVNSPFVGTFYRAPSPEARPYVDVGQRVHKGQILCIVEAMKLMNEIEAEVDGTVAAVMVENAQPVEYGQALFKIEP
jgi:acetyl-CoA carboxylase biotin carboxyl carrier protein